MRSGQRETAPGEGTAGAKVLWLPSAGGWGEPFLSPEGFISRPSKPWLLCLLFPPAALASLNAGALGSLRAPCWFHSWLPLFFRFTLVLIYALSLYRIHMSKRTVISYLGGRRKRLVFFLQI